MEPNSPEINDGFQNAAIEERINGSYNKPRSFKFNKILLLAIPVVLLTSILLLLPSQPVSEEVAAPVVINTSEVSDERLVKIYRQEEGLKIPVFTSPVDWDLYMVRWNDFIVYETHGSGKSSIEMHDLNSGETSLIGEIVTNREQSVNMTVRDLYLIDDTVYVSYATFPEKGVTYWVDLKSPEGLNKLVDSYNSHIVKYADNYWLVGGYGDGTYQGEEILLIDTQTKSVTSQKLIESKDANIENILFVDNEKIVTATYKANMKDIVSPDKIYNSINAYYLTDIDKKVELFNFNEKTCIPEYAFYDETGDRLILVDAYNPSVFELNLENNSLSLIGNIPEMTTEIASFYLLDSANLCVRYSSHISSNFYELNLSAMSVSENVSDACGGKYSLATENLTSRAVEDNRKVLESLNLPENYSYELLVPSELP